MEETGKIEEKQKTNIMQHCCLAFVCVLYRQHSRLRQSEDQSKEDHTGERENGEAETNRDQKESEVGIFQQESSHRERQGRRKSEKSRKGGH